MPINVIVLYAPGCFGSHVANLLSLDQKFQPSFDVNGYDLGKPNAHHGRPTMGEVVRQQKYKTDGFLDTNNVWAEHLSTLIHHESIKKFVDDLKNKFFLVINLPEFGSEIYHRMNRIGFSVSNLAFYELNYVYTPRTCARLLDYSQKLFWNLDPEIVWQHDAGPLIQFLRQSSPLDLDIDSAIGQEIHSKWYDSVSKSLL